MNHKQAIIDLYELFYKEFTGNKSFRLDLNRNKQEVKIDNFIKNIGKYYNINSIGIDFLVRYFLFQFYYWKDKNTNRKIQIEWVIGKKALERFLRNGFNEKFEFFIHKENDIDFSEIYHKFAVTKYQPDFNEESERERMEKKRFFNTEAGLVNCLENTSLYNPKSDICNQCNFVGDCKELLKQNYYKLYKARLNG